MSEFTKLSNLIGDTFTVIKVQGFTYKQWDNVAKKMLSSDVQISGYRKLYQVESDKGLMDLGPQQYGNLLESVSSGGKSDIIGRTFEVKSNGKQGMEIRYYLNPQPLATEEESQDSEDFDQPINLSEIPF